MSAAVTASAIVLTLDHEAPKPSQIATSASAKPIIEEVVEYQELAESKWSDADVQAIAQTLAGECYEDKAHDKRMVCEVILNRVSDERFADTIIDVLETPGAFQGYWHQPRDISENDLEIAEQTLADWYANDCQPLSDYRFFCAGEDRENSFY